MEIVIVIVFVLGYLAIAMEHPLKINKTATALLTGVVCWTLFILSDPIGSVVDSKSYASFLHTFKNEVGDKFNALTSTELYHEFVTFSLSHHLSEIAQILFFLLGAMTIVELVDAHHGFRFITDKIKTKNPKTLLWIICWVAFFLSSVLDNLTTTIVMLSLVRKLIPNKEMRMFFAGMIVIAANAGGAWTPIGDVTTTMLWIGGQISTGNIMLTLFLPSVACMLVPLLYLNFTLKGTLGETHEHDVRKVDEHEIKSGKLLLVLGISALVFVPIYKTITHMPPYMGMLLGLGILWVVSELINPHLDSSIKKHYTAVGALGRIDVPSVLFFLGILMAVGALESMQTLHHLAVWLDHAVGDQRIIVTLIGLFSAVIDNVPLVAASMGMYSMDVYHIDHMVWEMLAYCAGTGGSILIIGSAAGVAAMGIEKIDFIWYVKKISVIALMGYFAGVIIYLLIQPIFAVHPPH
jgi:Na+/H+ antiporter NhaD/arsenite permease-like protein